MLLKSLNKSRTLALACVLAALCWSGTANARAQYPLVGGGDGGQLQIGTGLPLPIQVYQGGTMTTTAATFPPLLVPPVGGPVPGGATVGQGLSTAAGGFITIQPGLLSRLGPGIPALQPTFPTNPAVYQVNTSIDYAFPSANAVLAPGGAPGPAVLGAQGGFATYSGGAKAFGGAAQFAVGAGVGSAGGVVPGQPVTVFINYMGQLPGTMNTLAIVGAAVGPLGQPGASVGAATNTTPGVAANPGFGNFSAGPAGTILATNSLVPVTGLTNMVTGSKGFPWTTGMLTLSQPAAVPPEIFYLSGTDMRVGGVGNISLVSGSLSTRALSGPNANRGWISMTLPEPTVAASAGGAFAMLALCHVIVRRRRSA
jgi:hypothetical protein